MAFPCNPRSKIESGMGARSPRPKRRSYMIISKKSQEANRQNAQHSSGPKTPEGKAAIRFNALTFGLRTRATVLPDENAADYFQLWDDFDADGHPQTRIERAYWKAMVTSKWLLGGVVAREQKVFFFIKLGEQN